MYIVQQKCIIYNGRRGRRLLFRLRLLQAFFRITSLQVIEEKLF